MVDKPKLSVASDYAVLTANGVRYYYGYEETTCPVLGHETACPEDCGKEEWCFTATHNGMYHKIPFSGLGANNMFNCAECLLLGIGQVITQPFVLT